jgi:anti-sigma28 factor (negative regulator of flagellin synthesis)
MNETATPKRKRSMTSLALAWLTERMSRAEEVKQALSSGTYKVPAEQVARALINPDKDEQPAA